MAKKKDDEVVSIDGKEYSLNKLSDTARMQLLNIQFVDTRVQQLNNELAVADTARIGYTNALKQEISKLDKNAD